MPAHPPVSIDSHALGTLRYIRSTIDAASSLAVPGTAGVVMGAVGAAATALASLPALGGYWLEIWLAAAAIAAPLGGALVLRQAFSGTRAALFAPLRRFLFTLCPALLAGAILTFVFLREDARALLPGTWLLLYGCAIAAASTAAGARTAPLIAAMGVLFGTLGLAAFLAPIDAHTALLGLGFGGLHVLFGALIGRANRAG